MNNLRKKCLVLGASVLFTAISIPALSAYPLLHPFADTPVQSERPEQPTAEANFKELVTTSEFNLRLNAIAHYEAYGVNYTVVQGNISNPTSNTMIYVLQDGVAVMKNGQELKQTTDSEIAGVYAVVDPKGYTKIKTVFKGKHTDKNFKHVTLTIAAGQTAEGEPKTARVNFAQ